MGATVAGWVLLLIAGGLALAGALPAALFVALAAGLVAVTAPTADQRSARRRNPQHARRVR